MKPVPTYLVEFAKNLIDCPSLFSQQERNAYGHILICVYTGVPFALISKQAEISKGHLWFTQKTQKGEKVATGIELPFEMLYLLNRRSINLEDVVKNGSSRQGVQSMLEALSKAGQQKVSICELPSLFRFMCSKSTTLQKAMTHRINMLSLTQEGKVVPLLQPSERILKGISLSTVTGKRVC